MKKRKNPNEIPKLTEKQVKSALGEIVPPRPALQRISGSAKLVRGSEAIADIKEKLTQRSAEIVSAALAFSEIDPNNPEPPESWVEEHGLEAATRRWRVALSAWQNAKAAPVGITLARSILVGILKADAMEKAPPAQLAVAVQMNVTPKSYPEQDVE